MSSLSDVSVVSTSFFAGFVVVTLIALAATVLLLTRLASRRRRTHAAEHVDQRRGCFRRRRRFFVAALPAVLVCQLLVTGLAATKINMSLRFATTIGQVAQLATGPDHASGPTRLAPVTTPSAADGGEGDEAPQTDAPSTPDPAYVASLEQTTEEDNTYKTTFHGPASDITDDVWFWTPRGYSPTDGKSYNVLVFLHGVPGAADGMVSSLDLGAQVQAAIDDGRLPPTIIVVPSLNADATQRSAPDCADVVGRAKVGTWIQEDVPKMVQATFSGARTDREGWALGGVSSGGYCAVWTTIMRSDVYSSAISMSGYDVPDVGGLSTPELRKQNTLSTLVDNQPHEPINLWLLGAQDDPLDQGSITNLPPAVEGDDTVEVDRPVSGGHSWALWKEQTPVFLTWWSQRSGVNPNGAAPPTAAPTPTPTATPTADDSSGAGPAPDAAGTSAGESGSNGMMHRLARSFTQIRGTGIIMMLSLATIALLLACLSQPTPRAVQNGESGTVARSGEGDSADEAGGAGDTDGHDGGGDGPAPSARWTTAARVAARAGLLVGTCVLTMFLVGLISNRIGAFYLTWSEAWADIGPALR